MKFSVKRNELTNKLNIVSRAISGKVIIPILTGIKISVSNNEMTLIGSNSEISIKTVLTADKDKKNLVIEEPGEIIANANFFSNIIKHLSSDKVEISTEGSQIAIVGGSSDFTVAGQSADNYPQLPRLDDANTINIPSSELIDIIGETIRAVSIQDSRPLLTGIHFTIGDNQIKAVSTDSHRLSQRITKIGNDSQADVVVPSKALIELRALLENIDNLNLQFDRSQLLVDLGETTFYSRLLEGQYPATDRLIPSDSTTSFTIDAAQLAPSLDRASLVAHQSGNIVAEFSISQDKLVLSTAQSEVGKVLEELSIDNFKGEDLKISFNPDFVRDALSSIGESKLDFSFTTNLRPFVIRPNDASDNNKVQLITPVRTF
ncbi:DNA polymerase III subunit beta [Oenococcus oeni]|uniref:DNA polymerase III subunit beta n=1 Tax=Oenococcus oeni TaxID=1247 RepID=UPI0008F8DE49|nr:DNA polymerase III subunit beta [Oenococcus oeni]OIK58071.1 DNA polymerase III subunit beta [Oenococcus oeni]OIM65122.1 DNA polymerase III subunit beta [Oenococcus oeni]SYW00575.1 DNA polymerase III subunit beta [Oenococcus oeni]